MVYRQEMKPRYSLIIKIGNVRASYGVRKTSARRYNDINVATLIEEGSYKRKNTISQSKVSRVFECMISSLTE